ncbi:hypothetical protein [Kribbella sp. NPDC004536]|uniref:hypothetical protein n=1 Tax=Kribbella sp. NPDC004536 TaxID=3364106 RepID=UPI0036B6B994
MTRKMAAWLVLTVGALVVLLAWVFPDAIEHRGQIHTVGTEVVLCAGEHHLSTRSQALHHLADCAGDNTEVRRELRDEVSAIFLIGITVAGTWYLARHT